MRQFAFMAAALGIGVAMGYFGSDRLRASSSGQIEFAYPAPDPNPKYVKLPKPGESYACEPLARGNVFDNRFSNNATIWVSQSASTVAVRIGPDGRQLMLMFADSVSIGITDPQELKITLNSQSYLMAEQELTLGKALIIFDVRTMKMIWSFNGQGMLGMKGKSVLYQCR